MPSSLIINPRCLNTYLSSHLHLPQDLISSFLSTVPAGFPLSPGPYLADIACLAPLSPGTETCTWPGHLAVH